VDGFAYDPAGAARVIKFIETFCRRVGDDGRNHPVKLLDWHKTGLIEPVFGWKHPDGRRRYRKAGLFVPKNHPEFSMTHHTHEQSAHCSHPSPHSLPRS
jgi:phage terminase large subunit-like protein